MRYKISGTRNNHATKRNSATKRRTGRKNRRSCSTARRRKARAIFINLFVITAISLACYLIYIYLVSPYTSRWQALYGKEYYPEGYSIRGIDVSHHQGDINWRNLSRAQIGDDPVSFVFIKATEGKDFLDTNFNENFYQAREYGLIRGAYHYFKPNVSAKEQAHYFLKQVHLEEGDLPPVLDIEEQGDLTPKELQKASLIWLKTVEARYKVPPIIYTNYKFKIKYLNTKDFDRYPYWIAHYYVRNLTYRGAWKFWQHTDCGKVSGIRHNVDLNIYNGSMYELRRLCLEPKDLPK